MKLVIYTYFWSRVMEFVMYTYFWSRLAGLVMLRITGTR